MKIQIIFYVKNTFEKVLIYFFDEKISYKN